MSRPIVRVALLVLLLQAGCARPQFFIHQTYDFSVVMKCSRVRCQASLAAASSKRGVVSL